MLARRIVAKHVTKTTALAMLGATAVLSVLQVLFTYLGELGSLNENYGAWQAFLYVLWGAPRYLYEILPISALIGAVLGLGTLASNSELVVMRSVGISLWRIVELADWLATQPGGELDPAGAGFDHDDKGTDRNQRRSTGHRPAGERR